jgi:hypothetical protein
LRKRGSPWLIGLVGGLVGALLAVAAPAEKTPGGDDWKYDTVYRKKGSPFRGLVLEQSAGNVLLKSISRRVGSPTIVIETWLPREEIDHVDLLDPKDRDVLQKRLQALSREREMLSAQLKLLDPSAKPDPAAVENVALKKADWLLDAKKPALAYDSAHFKLISSGGEVVTTLAVYWLELYYGAYEHALPPRQSAARPTTIVLTATRSEYQELVRDQGRNFFNPAFYDPSKNQIICFSDLQRLSDERDRVRKYNQVKLGEWKEYEAELLRAYKNKPPADLLAQVAEARKNIKATEDRNDAGFKKAQDRLRQRLAHEAFHAYLGSYVYPPDEGELPRWLAEGLAQIFESAIVEAGELRVGHAEPERLEALRQALTKGTLPDLTDLLRSGPKQFQVAHASEQQAVDRYYLASWALAFHLSFARKALGTKRMDEYVRTLRRGTDPLDAFRDLIGKPVDAFEKEYLQYLRNLRADGTSVKTPAK